jgi:hypothetical protein
MRLVIWVHFVLTSFVFSFGVLSGRTKGSKGQGAAEKQKRRNSPKTITKNQMNIRNYLFMD